MKKILTAAVAIAATMISLSLSAQERFEWPNYARYQEDNAKVLKAQAEGAKKPVAVLMGDSITDGWPWNDAAFFTDNNFIGRGISGQCTAHMLARFQRDVVELHPKYVAIMAGTNDVALNDGFSSVENAYRNIVSMCQIAKQNKIKVILCSTTPADHYGWRPEVGNPNATLKWLNDSLKAYAKANHLKFADYAAALADETGATSKQYSKDSVHPNLEGYKVMEQVLLDVLK